MGDDRAPGDAGLKGTKTATLGELASPRQWPILPQQAMSEQGFPVYGANGKIGFSQTFTHERPVLLIGCRGSCGTIHLTEPFSYANGNAMALDNLDPDRVDIRYAYFFLRQRGFQDVTTGSSQPQIIRQNLVRVNVPVPPISEQRRIAAILDQADTLRTKRRAALAQLDQIPQAIFQEMFGCPLHDHDHNCVPFESITRRITYGFTSPMSHLLSGIPIITAKNIRENKIDLTPVHYADENEFNELTEKSKPAKGDLLITKDGTIGRCAIHELDRQICINQSVALVQVDYGKVMSSFVLTFLTSPEIQSVLKGMSKGNAVPHLQITELAKIGIKVPPLELQAKFDQRRNCVLRTRASMLSGVENAESLFASLQHCAFRGEL